MRLAFFQPDIPQNIGSALRLAACLGVAIDIIEPVGFIWSEHRMRRAGMDYIDRVDIQRYPDWTHFITENKGRLLLLTTKGSIPYTDIHYQSDDIVLLGRESSGVPDFVHQQADHRLLIPMISGMRSLNVVNTAAMVLGEALRQTEGFPKENYK